MMLPESVHDRGELERLLREDPALRSYELGDLDDFFWPHTTWYRHGDSVALVYHGTGLPILLALDRLERVDSMAELVDGLALLLPQRFYAHVSVGVEGALGKHFRLEPGGLHHKMALTDPHRLDGFASAGEVLTDEDLTELSRLYLSGYPRHAFDPRLLQTGQYVGLRRGGRLVAVAGVHIWSPAQRVATLGNVVTHPDFRGRGLGTAAVATVCRRIPVGWTVALNVKADNASAIALYTRLGFSHVADYLELDAFPATESGQAR
ncbi:MAG TPA: GNAT family N-acetyltransferase [Candidatus Limnocylindrales bacterium]|nr:GNAT family N-acetyltransferase [Candidatus Limnocylindrales bacterium]